MINFGYTPLVSNLHDLDTVDRSLEKQIVELDPSFNLCIACGSCAATCTTARFTDFSFRNLCHRIRRGEVNQAIEESEKCMLCGKCTLICPRNVNTRNIIALIRKAV